MIFRLTEQEVVSLPEVDTWDRPGEEEEMGLRSEGGQRELQEGSCFSG